jgi:hypothetical protein
MLQVIHQDDEAKKTVEIRPLNVEVQPVATLDLAFLARVLAATHQSC